MCQATVYLGEEKVAQDIIRLDLVEDGIRIATFFEEPRLVPGRIRTIDFLKHSVILEPIEEGQNERD
jgi:predicted RNA-binding protein